MKATIGVGVGCLVLGGLGIWAVHSSGVSERDDLREKNEAVTAEIDTLRAERDRLSRDASAAGRDRDKLSAKLDETVGRLTAMEKALETEKAARATAEAAVEAATGGGDSVVEEPSATAFHFENLDKALAAVDWKAVGTSMGNMPPLIEQLADALGEGKSLTELPPSLLGEIQGYNAPLITTAMGLVRDGVPGTGINGSFSHPGFMLNALAASLDQMGMPLTSDQRSKLKSIGDEFVQRDEQRLASYDDRTTDLTEILGESDLKHAFFQDVYRVLTEKQNTALRPKASRGRLQLDIFSEALMWTGRAGPLKFSDADDLKAKTRGWVMDRGKIPLDRAADVKAVVDDWVDGLPSALRNTKPSGLDDAGMMHVDHVSASAHAVNKLLGALQRDLMLDDAGSAGIRSVPGSIVLYLGS